MPLCYHKEVLLIVNMLMLWLLVLLFANTVSAKNWFVAVAGTDHWGWYRHQADVYAAWQMVKDAGTDMDNVILFAYDNIAYDYNNPTPGVVINEPCGKNVYDGVIIDYKGEDVTAKNFLNVLLGDKEAMDGIGSGRVLESTLDDNVVVMFSGLGDYGSILVARDMLTGETLVNTLKTMQKNRMFNKLAFYLESSFSGSMFDTLPDNVSNIFAMTASTPYEHSYATFYDTYRNTWLADEFSFHWRNYTDYSNLHTDMVGDQFDNAYDRVLDSTVSKYGDLSIEEDLLATFFGSDLTKPVNKHYEYCAHVYQHHKRATNSLEELLTI